MLKNIVNGFEEMMNSTGKRAYGNIRSFLFAWFFLS